MKRVVQIVGALLIFSIFTGCLQWPSSMQANARPDKLLYYNAVHATEHSKYDVAALTLQTLINTYPDSDYAEKAKQLLRDPRFADVEITSGGVGVFFPK